MGGLIADELERQGYELVRSVEAGLPMAVWAVDLEVERQRNVTAAELAVLGLIDSGVSNLSEITTLIGMGTDERLAEDVVVRMLAGGALDRSGEGFVLTDTGRVWSGARLASGRERITREVRLDPLHGRLEWVDHERPMFATPETWTIDLGSTSNDDLLARRAQLGDLVREVGIPDDEGIREEDRPSVELRSFAVVTRRTHWRSVRLDFWTHPAQQDLRWVGYVGDAENPPLTRLLEHHLMQETRRWLVPPA